MSRKGTKYTGRKLVKSNSSRTYSLGELDALQQEIEVRRQLEIEKSLRSSDPQAILAAQAYLQRQNVHQDGLKSYLFDPNYESLNTNGYRVPLKTVNFDTMRKMAKTPVILTVIGTRKDQVAGFAEPVDNDQEKGWKIRRKKSLFSTGDEEISDEDKRTIEELTNFILNGGNLEDSKWDFDGFEEILREITDDSLTIDQLCMEMVYTRGGQLCQYYPVDSTTIRLVDTNNTVQLAAYTKPMKGYWPRYCQVWEDNICAFYYPWELTFGVRNKTTSIKSNGYGQPELEDLVQIVTWLLFGMQYNGNFFCISGDSKIMTNKGVFHVESLVGQAFQTFDGKKWNSSTAYQTEVLDLYVTTLKNGLQLRTSSKHKFLICTPEGEILWKKQSELQKGDYALVSSSEQDFTCLEMFNIGKLYERTFTNPTGEVECKKPVTFIPTQGMVEDEEFWEIVGFALGDGHWGENLLQIFPHWKKDVCVFEKAKKVFTKYGIHWKEVVINKSETRSDGEKGYPAIYVYHTTFLDWLYDLGFGKSGSKRVPMPIFNLSLKLKGAFLRGWFSADGHTQRNKLGYATPSVFCVDNKLRQDCLQLLLATGVWSTVMKVGTSVGYSNGDYFQIRVQDIDAFVERVGYLQDYKNEGVCRNAKTKNKWDLVPNTLAKELLEGISASKDRMVDWVRKGSNISRKKLISILEKAGRKIPSILHYHFVPIFNAGRVSVGKEQLYDIEVFNDEHIFLSDFVAVHNSQGSNPKGFFSIEGNIPPSALNDFKQMWRNTQSGVWNAHKIPVIETGGSKVNWTNMMGGNMKDMEFHKWLEFLIVLVCCIYKIDPTECGFNLEGMRSIFGQDGQKARLKHSQTKGLTPILKLIQRIITKYIIEPLNEDFEFVFCGVETDDQEKVLEMDVKKIQNGFMSLEDGFKKYSGREFDPEKDTILNSVYQQSKQASMMGGGMMNDMVDGMNGEQPIMGEEENPFEKALIDYLYKGIKEGWNE